MFDTNCPVSHIHLPNNKGLRFAYMVMAKGDRRDVGFQDGGCFSRFLKRERINNLTFISFPRLTLTLP